MAIERIKLIHQIREAIIEPNTFSDEIDLGTRFKTSLESISNRPDLSVSSFPLSVEQLEKTKNDLVTHFVSVASDLGTFNLAQGHLDRLFAHLTQIGAISEKDLLKSGATEFY